MHGSKAHGIGSTETVRHFHFAIVFEMQDELAPEGESSANFFLFDYLEKHGVTCYTGAKMLEINDDGIVCEKDGVRCEYKGIQNVVLALGSKPENPLQAMLEGKVGKIIVVGDAMKVAQGIDAISAGYRAGYYI